MRSYDSPRREWTTVCRNTRSQNLKQNRRAQFMIIKTEVFPGNWRQKTTTTRHSKGRNRPSGTVFGRVCQSPRSKYLLPNGSYRARAGWDGGYYYVKGTSFATRAHWQSPTKARPTVIATTDPLFITPSSVIQSPKTLTHVLPNATKQLCGPTLHLTYTILSVVARAVQGKAATQNTHFNFTCSR